MTTKLNIVVLAAGQGKRMYSTLPKVLHSVGGMPMLARVLGVAQQLDPARLIVVHGHEAKQVKDTIDSIMPELNITWVFQEKQLGTGHALKCAASFLDNDAMTLVLYGDVPLITTEILQSMLKLYDNSVVMLTAELDKPTGYGRVIRNQEFQIVGIVEEKDATQSEKCIHEVNTGFYVLPNKHLLSWLDQLSSNNQQAEYYLTDVIKIAYAEAVEITSVTARHNYEIMGVNNKLELEHLERVCQIQLANKLLESGVTLIDKSRIDIRGKLITGTDCVIDINCIFSENVSLGNNVSIGIGCVLKNVIVHDNVEIKPYTIIENAEIGSDSKVGPYSRIRPGTKLASGTHVGNFVEIKNSNIGVGSKVNHLSYIGDSDIGDYVNVGAGSVTCNYDGKNKHKTIIKDKVFVGSGTMMVAPITIGESSIIGAGSTITKDVPANELTVARAKQVTVTGWIKRNKKLK